MFREVVQILCDGALSRAAGRGRGSGGSLRRPGTEGESTHPVIGVGDVHGGDAQEVKERCVVAASAQSAQAAKMKATGVGAAGVRTRPPTSSPCRGPGLTWE